MKKKLMLYTITVIVIVNLFVMSISLNSIKNDYTRQKQDELKILTSTIIKSLGEEKNKEIANFEDVFKNNGIRATLIDDEGRVLYETEDDLVNMYNHKNRPEIQAAYKGITGMDIRKSNTLRENFLYVAMPIDYSNYVLRLATSLNSINISMKDIIIRTIIIILISMIVASGFIILLVEKKFVKPIAKLANASMEIDGVNMPEKIYYHDKDEIGDLYHKYNMMLDRISEEISNKNESNLFLESILANMNSGVIALNHERQIVFINKKGLEILNIEDSIFEQVELITVIRDFEINNFIDDYYENRTMSESKFDFNGKIIKIIINILPLTNDFVNTNYGAVLLIEDISESYHLEEMRSDFAANVTHELKTPLTSIKGFVETIKNNEITDKNKLDRFLDIIDIEADRLRNLIDDILLLSEMESIMPNLEEIHFPLVIEEIKSIMAPIAKKNQVTINYEIEDIFFYSNPSRIKQLLIILIDNAIKYNNENGKVNVHVYLLNDIVNIDISDTGIGISTEHIDRIYERFYRVDKSRSRIKGGTGLGLAIAKHIVMSLDGNISVKSKANEGTKFCISFQNNI